MNKMIRVLIPVTIGLGLAAVAIFVFLAFFSGAASPETAATSYIKASMKQDVGSMMRYASDYQKTVLYGSKGFTESALRSKLKTAYGYAENIYAESTITFTTDSVRELDSGSDEYTEALEKYEFMTGSRDISGIAVITVTVYVDGNRKYTSTVTAVKKGLYWYYAY